MEYNRAMHRTLGLIKLALLLGLGIVAIVSCKSGTTHSLVGTWGYDKAPASADTAYRFAPDGKYEYWFKGSKINVQDSGTYKFENDTLTIDRQSHTGSSGKVDSSPETIKMNVRWLSNDSIELSDSESSNTWTRRP